MQRPAQLDLPGRPCLEVCVRVDPHCSSIGSAGSHPHPHGGDIARARQDDGMPPTCGDATYRPRKPPAHLDRGRAGATANGGTQTRRIAGREPPSTSDAAASLAVTA
jgi:hypothetical protein